MKKFLLILFFPSLCFGARTIEDKVHVLSYKAHQGEYRVQFLEKNAYYNASKAHLKCLDYSMKSRSQVMITFDVDKMKVVSCKK